MMEELVMSSENGFTRMVLVVLLLVSVTCAAAEDRDPAQAVLDRMRDINAIQSVYMDGVPHTDAQGRMMMRYDPKRSFLQIAVWGCTGPGKGTTDDWDIYPKAGFNTLWPWNTDPLPTLEAAAKHGLQIVLMGGLSGEALKKAADNPRLLGIVWRDEPTLHPAEDSMKLLTEFTTWRDEVKRVRQDLPVFANMTPWIMPPALTNWVRWTQAGDLSCHDNYPIMDRGRRAESVGADPNGIPQSVAMAAAAVDERKPVWLIVGAFTLAPPAYGESFPFRYPTPLQLRASVYAGLIHGATGIIYFTPDSYISRDGGVIGMSPRPEATPHIVGGKPKTPATPLQLIQARALWDTAAQINSELKELTPALLAPTVSSAEVPFTVAVTGRGPTQNPVRCLLKPHPDGGWVLLTVNVDDAVLRVSYGFPRGLEEAQVLYENRSALSLEKDGTRFTLDYEPFDAHVVRIKPKAK